jgi:hypothetical protein
VSDSKRAGRREREKEDNKATLRVQARGLEMKLF